MTRGVRQSSADLKRRAISTGMGMTALLPMRPTRLPGRNEMPRLARAWQYEGGDIMRLTLEA